MKLQYLNAFQRPPPRAPSLPPPPCPSPRLDEYDATAARARVAFELASLWVDVSKVPRADPPRLGSLYQYIGEVDSSAPRVGEAGKGTGTGTGTDIDGDRLEPRPILRARVARCVDGLDIALYKRALDVRNLFLNAPSPAKRRSTIQPPP
jgi:hypothetical protein